MSYGPSPIETHPMEGFPRVCYIRKTVRNQNIVVGNHAQVIQARFSPDEVALLESIAWWEWPIEKITRNLATITGGDEEEGQDASGGVEFSLDRGRFRRAGRGVR